MTPDPSFPWPLMAVARDRRTPGANTLEDSVDMLDVLPLDQALTKSWGCDAHAVQYLSEDDAPIPRCNKLLLPAIRGAGGDLLARVAFFDWDMPQHARLTPTAWDAFCGSIFRAEDEGLQLAGQWAAIYSTPGGGRVVFVLEHPIPVDIFEAFHRATVRAFTRHGVPLDPVCSDWTRLFRLPSVTRPEGRSEEMLGELAEVVLIPRAVDLTLAVTPTEDDRMRSRARTLTAGGDASPAECGPMPDPVKARALLWQLSPATARDVMTEWHKAVRRRLSRHEAAGAFWGIDDIGPQGHRHGTMLKWAGTIARALYHLPGTTPEHIWALFLEPCARIDRSTCRQPPEQTAWEVVAYCWMMEAEKDGRRVSASRSVEEQAATMQEEVLFGVRSWCTEPTVHGDDDTAWDWLQRRLIVCTTQERFILKPDGFYDAIGVPMTLLSARIREIGMEPFMPLMLERPEGGFRPVKPQEIVDKHGTVVASVEGAIGCKGGIVRNMGLATSTLVVRLFGRREDLTPRWDDDVDEWLAALAGGRQTQEYIDLCKWIGLSLAFDEGPICALSLFGPPSTGKGLLMQGLAECVDTERYSDAHEFGDFQSGIAKSPFLCVNEGIPEKVRGDIADQFRLWVDGSPMNVNQKFQTPYVIRNPLRVVFTANNEDVVAILAGRKDLTAADRQALALRLWHLEVGPTGAKYLALKGGYNFTGRNGRRWVRGPSGQPSDYVMARHFLALYDMRPASRDGARFLMEGPMDSDLMTRLAMRAGHAPEIVETLVLMIECKVPPKGLAIKGSQIYVTSTGVVDYHRAVVAPKSRRSMSWSTVNTVIEAFKGEYSPDGIVALKGAHGESQRAKWKLLDLPKLLIEAEEKGLICQRLKAIVRYDEPTERLAEDIKKLTEEGL